MRIYRRLVEKKTDLTSPPSAIPLQPSLPRVHANLSPPLRLDFPHPILWGFPPPTPAFSCAPGGCDPIKPLPLIPLTGEEVEPDASLEFGFQRSFSNTSTRRNSARQCLSSSLSSSRTPCNHEMMVFQKGDMIVELTAGRREDRVKG